jgi:hypothetical protein
VAPGVLCLRSMPRPSGPALRVAVLLLAIALTGCATKLRHVPNSALARQSSTAMERDQRACEKAITGTLKGVWFPAEIEFASCMISRNYQVYVQVLDASVEVKKASLRRKVPPARILTDLVACEQVVKEKVSIVEMIGRPTAVVAGVFFWPVSIGSMAASSTLHVYRQRDYAACMAPRGYVVTPWEPRPGEPGLKPQTPQDQASP